MHTNVGVRVGASNFNVRKMALQRDPVVSRALAATDKNSGTTEVATGVRPDRKHGK